MNREQILETIKSLSYSQGMYKRMLNDFYAMSLEDYDQFMTNLENKHFKSPLDLVLYLEV